MVPQLNEEAPKPLFTIAIVSLNPGPQITQTIKSVQEQSCQDLEILVKDGGSTDPHVDRLELSKSIRFIRQADKGIFDAMNQAIDLCRGRFVQFLNCGDILFDNRVLEGVAACIQAHPQANIFFGDVHKPGSRSGYIRYPKRLSRYAIYCFPVCHQAWFVRHELYQRNRFSTASEIGGDDLWWTQRIAGESVHYRKVNRIVVTYRGGGISENTELKERSLPFRKSVRKEVFSSRENWLYPKLFRLRTAVKRRVFDPFIWKVYRKYQHWRVRHDSRHRR